MRSRRLAALTAAAALLLAAPAFAQGDDADSGDVTEYEFEKHDVTGGMHGATGTDIRGVEHDAPINLLEVRKNFVDEMIRTTDDL